jgi:hypothetical protein
VYDEILTLKREASSQVLKKRRILIGQLEVRKQREMCSVVYVVHVVLTATIIREQLCHQAEKAGTPPQNASAKGSIGPKFKLGRISMSVAVVFVEL